MALAKILWGIWVILLFVFLGIFLKSEISLNFKEIRPQISGNISSQPDLKTNNLKLIPQKAADLQEPQILAKTFYLIDIDSFYPLAQKDENLKVPVASTTKIATALVVLENYINRLDEIVTINSQMISVDGSDIELRSGEKITVENLLNGLLIESGNDCATALAEHFGGREKFVQEMNDLVQRIGLKNTRFYDPAGLNDLGYSTAQDLAILGAYALRNEKFAEIVGTRKKTVASIDGRLLHNLETSNRLLKDSEQYYYPYAKGIKTGFTPAAGHVLVSYAEKDNRKILGVVLYTYEDTLVASAKESKKLLEWGFKNWQ